MSPRRAGAIPLRGASWRPLEDTLTLLVSLALAAPADLQLRCGNFQQLGGYSRTLDFVHALSDQLPTDGPMAISASPEPAGTEIRVEATLSAADALPEWLASYQFIESSPGRWSNPGGASMIIDHDHVVYTRHSRGRLRHGEGALPPLGDTTAGCSITFRADEGLDGAAVRLDFAGEGGAVVRLPGAAPRWRDVKPGRPAVTIDRFDPVWSMRLNIARPGRWLRAMPRDRALPGVLDPRWADHIATGAEIHRSERDFLAVLPVSGASAAELAAQVGVEPVMSERGPFWVASLGDALLVASRPDLLARVKTGQAADPAWDAPGMLMRSRADARPGGEIRRLEPGDGRALLWGPDGELESMLFPRNPSFAQRLPSPPPTVYPTTPTEEPEVCAVRGVVTADGELDNLAISGCRPLYAQAVRTSAAAWIMAPIRSPTPIGLTEFVDRIRFGGHRSSDDEILEVEDMEPSDGATEAPAPAPVPEFNVRTAKVTRLGPTTTGPLSAEKVGASIDADLPSLRFCYMKELYAHHDLEGQIQLKFRILPDGTPAEQTADGEALPMHRCVVDRFFFMRFPKAKQASTAEVTLRFTH